MSIKKFFYKLFHTKNNQTTVEWENIKHDHNVAVKLGTLGVSPMHMNMYLESVKKIREAKL
jgi:hypothetical protein